ncbi:hypothetical protein HQ520_07535 [bacterium]|nr:hypothetical protein [bacterium]
MGLHIQIGNQDLRILESTGFHIAREGALTFLSAEPVQALPSDSDPADFIKRHHGLLLVREESGFEIYTDPFRTVPLFYVESATDNLDLFSGFEDILRHGKKRWAPDPVGFWECLLFESPLWSRTILSEARQMPAASRLSGDLNGGNLKLQRYWDFCVPEDASIDSAEKAADGLFERLDRGFARLDRSQSYLLGMSGGLDCRLALCFLSRHLSPDQLELFTYGYDSRIYEYIFAGRVAAHLGFRKPLFHRLTDESYRSALETMPFEGGCQIGVQHCHIYSFLRELGDPERIVISTNYSDAVLGWDARYPARNDSIQHLSLTTTHPGLSLVPEHILCQIRRDAEISLSGYTGAHNYSSIEEYCYVIERNQKFHVYMAHLHRKFNRVLLPFADFDLATYMWSVPLQLRQRKSLSDYLLARRFDLPTRPENNISSRTQWGGSYSSAFRTARFKFLNRLNTALRLMTGGRFEWFNPFLTENQQTILYGSFQEDLGQSVSLLKQAGLLNEEQAGTLARPPVRFGGTNERYQCLALARFFEDIGAF